jgi:hypothetical protein
LSAPEAGLTIGQADSVVAALLEKRSALAADLAVAEDTVTCLRRQITALSETLKTCIFSSISASCVHRNRPPMFTETGQPFS